VIWTLPLIMIGFGKNGLLNSFRHDQDKTLFLSNANNFLWMYVFKLWLVAVRRLKIIRFLVMLHDYYIYNRMQS
jgi:hypothetical protein